MLKSNPFFKRREIWVPGIATWLMIFVLCTAGFFLFLKNIHSFLSPVTPKNAQVLIVEGWLPDYALEQAAQEFKTHSYAYCLSTGGPLDIGSYLCGYKNFAELGALTLRKLGIDSSKVYAVDAGYVEKDRTFASALAVQKWLEKNNRRDTVFNLFSIGCHTRRSHLLFAKVLGKQYSIGEIACNDNSYDKNHWYRYSAGVRAVIAESIAYAYGFIFFGLNRP